MTNAELMETYRSLAEMLQKYDFRARTCISLVRNKNRLKTAIESLEEARIKILERFASKNENGEPVIENGNYVIDDKNALSVELDELFKAEANVELEKIPMCDIGDNVFCGKYADLLAIIVE